jgi:glycosyltransferase involved in cell wall biosynthesis
MSNSLSIALVTRNRPEFLSRYLASLSQQSEQPAEIVVSDDSDPTNAALTRSVANKHGCRYIPGPRIGLYGNRTNAARACTTSHILTADDDHTYPPGFISHVHALIAQDPARIWVLSERSPDAPNRHHVCPAELKYDGRIGAPTDPSSCRAIADGSTIYPAEIFKAGLEYDTSYQFGGMWYLWGVYLSKLEWRISYDPGTFVFHHTESSIGRAEDTHFLRQQHCCNCYVSLAHAIWLEPNLTALLRSLWHLGRLVIIGDTQQGYNCMARIQLPDLLRLAQRLWQARHRYNKRRLHALW